MSPARNADVENPVPYISMHETSKFKQWDMCRYICKRRSLRSLPRTAWVNYDEREAASGLYQFVTENVCRLSPESLT